MALIDITAWDIITQDQFATMVFDSGIIVKNFDPATFETPDADDILCVTSGNITHNFKHTIVNLADDVNNIHIQPKETAFVTGYENPTIGFTALNCTPAMVKFLAGFATVSGDKVTPAMTIDTVNDFQNIALVLRCVGGGLVAIALSDALSTGGISLTTTKGGKGTFAVTITGYGTIENPSKIPVDYYAKSADTVSVKLDRHNVTITNGDTVKLNATTIPAESTVTWASDNTDVATVSSGTVTASAVGTVTITASITSGSTTATDTCTVRVTSAGA